MPDKCAEPKEKEGSQGYVELCADLVAMLSPQKYKVVFYAEEVFRGVSKLTWIMDSTNWISIPPAEFNISASPNSIALRGGENRFSELLINSTTDRDILVNLNVSKSKIPDYILFDISLKQLRIPPHGVGLSRVHLSVLPPADPRPYTIFFLTDIAVPSDQLSDTAYSTESNCPRIPCSTRDEIITIPSSFILTVEGPLSPEEQAKRISAILEPLDIIIGIGGGIVGFFIGRKS